jgi:hypothetical protein
MVELTNGQSVDLTVAYTDSAGTPAHPPGAVTWWSSDDSIASVRAGTDDTHATVASAADGTATITAESNGITCAIDIIVGAAEGAATEGQITAGEPYDGPQTGPLPGQGLPGRQPGQGLPPRLPGQQPGQRAPVPTPRATTAAAVVRTAPRPR